MASTTGWDTSTNQGSPGNDQSLNNSSGFNAFPDGYRSNIGSFNNAGDNAFFWSSTEYSANLTWNRNLNYNVSNLGRYFTGKQIGLSVRFVRD